jgi:hypothetical protein
MSDDINQMSTRPKSRRQPSKQWNLFCRCSFFRVFFCSRRPAPLLILLIIKQPNVISFCGFHPSLLMTAPIGCSLFVVCTHTHTHAAIRSLADLCDRWRINKSAPRLLALARITRGGSSGSAESAFVEYQIARLRN